MRERANFGKITNARTPPAWVGESVHWSQIAVVLVSTAFFHSSVSFAADLLDTAGNPPPATWSPKVGDDCTAYCRTGVGQNCEPKMVEDRFGTALGAYGYAGTTVAYRPSSLTLVGGSGTGADFKRIFCAASATTPAQVVWVDAGPFYSADLILGECSTYGIQSVRCCCTTSSAAGNCNCPDPPGGAAGSGTDPNGNCTAPSIFVKTLGGSRTSACWIRSYEAINENEINTKTGIDTGRLVPAFIRTKLGGANIAFPSHMTFSNNVDAGAPVDLSSADALFKTCFFPADSDATVKTLSPIAIADGKKLCLTNGAALVESCIVRTVRQTANRVSELRKYLAKVIDGSSKLGCKSELGHLPVRLGSNYSKLNKQLNAARTVNAGGVLTGGTAKCDMQMLCTAITNLKNDLTAIQNAATSTTITKACKQTVATWLTNLPACPGP